MATKVETCRACGSADLRPHCRDSRVCDGWRCARCKSWGTDKRVADARDKGGR